MSDRKSVLVGSVVGIIIGIAIAAMSGCGYVGGTATLHAQTLPYTLTVTWDPPSPALSDGYNCYLDGVKMTAAPVAGLLCSFPVTTLGPHTITVRNFIATSIPPESDPASLSFTLRSPAAPTAIKVR